MAHRPLISLVIPTRERGNLLRESLRTATAIQDKSIEIVVSDNASEDATASVVRENGDPRIRYLNTGQRVSMRQNFEHAFEHSSGDYVVYIGDDDGFLPRQFAALRAILEEQEPEVLAWNPVHYSWPNPGARAGSRRIRVRPTSMYGPVAAVSFGTWRRELLAGGAPYPEALPSVYHGCLSRKVLEEIRGRCGSAFAASSPDVFTSYYLGLTRPGYLRAHHAFTVNGTSPMSTGAATARFNPDDVSCAPAVRFMREQARDPVRDPIDHSVPELAINLLSVFEAARRAASLPADAVDYRGWYGYVLGSARKSGPRVLEDTKSILAIHASSVGAARAFAEVRDLDIASPRATRRQTPLGRLRQSIMTVKLPPSHGGRSGVHAAAMAIDAMLGDDYEAVRRNGTGASAALARARLRAIRLGVAHLCRRAGLDKIRQ